jgi:lipoprotein-anchoring transpeptidase ErfK/SrfK
MKAKKSFLLVLFLFWGMIVLNTAWASEAPPHTTAVRGKPVPEKVLSREPREVRVFLKAQFFGFYELGKLSFWGPVCTGAKGHETPRGKFRVLLKARRYFSREWGGAAMPYSVQFTAGGHFLHVGEIRPKPSSHGCVRLREEDAVRIFRTVKSRDPIIITD